MSVRIDDTSEWGKTFTTMAPSWWGDSPITTSGALTAPVVDGGLNSASAGTPMTLGVANHSRPTYITDVTGEQFQRLLDFLALPEDAKSMFLAVLMEPTDKVLFHALADWLESQDRLPESERMRTRGGKLS
jgi:hypothetical protein